MPRTEGLLDRVLKHAVVLETEQLRPRIRRIRLGGDHVGDLEMQPGQQIRVRVDDSGLLSALGRGKARDLLRTYSIWGSDRQRRWLDLCVYQREAGGTPGLDWARSVRVGDRVSFLGPTGRFVLDPAAGYHLFVGDETAQPAFAAMLGAVPSGVPVVGVIETATVQEQLDLRRAQELTWHVRDDASGLLRAVRGLQLPDTPGVAYVAGEAATVAAVRRHLQDERGWSRRSVRTKPFWAPGKRGLD